MRVPRPWEDQRAFARGVAVRLGALQYVCVAPGRCHIVAGAGEHARMLAMLKSLRAQHRAREYVTRTFAVLPEAEDLSMEEAYKDWRQVAEGREGVCSAE